MPEISMFDCALRRLLPGSTAPILTGLMCVVSFAGLGAQEAVMPDIEGTWAGTLSVPNGGSLRLAFNVTRQEDGTLSATMDSPDQGALGIPMDGVTLDGDTIRFTIAAVQGEYAGVLSEDGNGLSGLWKQGPMALPLDLERGNLAPPLPRPQDPERPLPYLEEEVRFPSADDGVELAGTFTAPRTGGPFPAVVLISGSGPQNRNEELMNHRPFLVLSDHLTRQGIAVLRYDDRGVAESTGDFASATSQDLARDVLGAVRYLAGRSEVDAARLGLVGHSEGGLIAPMVAADGAEVAFLVLLAGPGVPGDQILHRQAELIARASGASEASIELNRTIQQELFRLIREGVDAEEGVARAMELFSEELDTLSPEDLQALGVEDPEARAQALRQSAAATFTPWFRFFVTYDPRPTLEKVRVPVLALNGERDLQVPPGQNLPEIGAALERGGNPDHTEEELPGLNHLFQSSVTGAPSEYVTIAETMSPVMLERVSDWILERFGH
jgi:pimeloyl-ACP methyl ester carboxylesterase